MKKPVSNNSINQFSDTDIISIKLAAHTAPLIEEVKNQEYPYVLFSVDSSGKDRHKWRNHLAGKTKYFVRMRADYWNGKSMTYSNWSPSQTFITQ